MTRFYIAIYQSTLTMAQQKKQNCTLSYLHDKDWGRRPREGSRRQPERPPGDDDHERARADNQNVRRGKTTTRGLAPTTRTEKWDASVLCRETKWQNEAWRRWNWKQTRVCVEQMTGTNVKEQMLKKESNLPRNRYTGGGESVRNQFFDDNTIYHTVLVLSSSDPEVLK